MAALVLLAGTLALPVALVARVRATSAEPVATAGLRPISLSISAIDIRSEVQPVQAEERVLDIPPDPRVVGWWQDGVGVGADAGTAVLVAHLDSRRYGTGPFSRAKDLHAGDVMTLADARSGLHRYVVTAVHSYLKTALPYSELFTQSGPPRVVLVTCGGSFHADAGGWDSNVVVTFTPV